MISFQELNNIEHALEIKGHEYVRAYTAFEGDLRIISEKNGRQFRWSPVRDNNGEIVEVTEFVIPTYH